MCRSAGDDLGGDGTEVLLKIHEETPKPSRFRTLCRALSLNIVYGVWSDRRRTGHLAEHQKIALQRDRKNAFFAGLVHFLPANAAIAISTLNIIGYYIGGELSGPSGYDDVKFLGLQFASKLHEVLVLTSLGTVLSAYVRHELVLGDGVPFGAMFAGQSFHDVKFLVSLEFWGVCKGKFAHRKRRWTLVFILISCTVLGFSVGPSIASINKPRLDDWDAGGSDIWVAASGEALFPTSVNASQVPLSCRTDTGDRICPHGDWETLADSYLSFWPEIAPSGYIPEIIEVPGLKAQRNLYPRTRSPLWQFHPRWTVGTSPYSIIADALVEAGCYWAWAANNKKGPWRFQFRQDVTYRVAAQQPVVQTMCIETPITSIELDDSSTIPFYDLQTIRNAQQTNTRHNAHIIV